MTRDDGFSLIEVLVAFVCASLGLMTIYSALSMHARQSRLADLHNAALLSAQSQLDAVGSSIPLVPGELEGAYENGTRWRLSIAQIDFPPNRSPNTAQALAVEIDAFDPTGRPLARLITIKLAEPAP